MTPSSVPADSAPASAASAAARRPGPRDGRDAAPAQGFARAVAEAARADRRSKGQGETPAPPHLAAPDALSRSGEAALAPASLAPASLAPASLAPETTQAALAVVLARLAGAGTRPPADPTRPAAGAAPQGAPPGPAMPCAPDVAGAAHAPLAASLDAPPPDAAAFEAAPVALSALAAARHLPPARIEAAPAMIGEAAAAARPALIEAPATPAPATSLRLALTPEGLGEIEVTLRLRGGRLEAVLAADRPQTAALVETRRGELTEALRRAGYEVDPAAVAARVRPPEPAVAAQRAEAPQRDGQGEGGGRREPGEGRAFDRSPDRQQRRAAQARAIFDPTGL